jgi:hypothetical protein
LPTIRVPTLIAIVAPAVLGYSDSPTCSWYRVSRLSSSCWRALMVDATPA